MFAKKTLRHGLAPAALAVAMACALGACKKDEATADAGTAATQQAPAPTPESVVSATITAMNPDQLRTEASKAYGENRLYAPAGNNAMEYYLALRDKQPADAGASSALTDLLPMLPAYGLMAYPLKDTALWQYAVPFLAQNQLIQKITRGEAASMQQWGLYLACSLALAALLWSLAVWRYKQEKLAISA